MPKDLMIQKDRQAYQHMWDKKTITDTLQLNNHQQQTTTPASILGKAKNKILDEKHKSVRMNFCSNPESIRIWKCQNLKVSESIFVSIQKVSESENVRIRKCQNLKVSESFFVSIHKVSESENVRIWKCQNLKVSESESVRIGKCQNQFLFQSWKCLNLKVSESAIFRTGDTPNTYLI